MFNDKVAHETRLITDGWAAYKGVKKLGVYWDWVNPEFAALKVKIMIKCK